MTNRVRVGIAGLGTATRLMLPALMRHPGVELCAAASSRFEERRAFESDFGLPTCADIGDLCALADVDAVYISTPTHLHKEHVLTALRYGKHVLVEKPLTTDFEAGLELVAAAESSGCVVMVGHSHSYDPPIRAMREVIQSGRLGALKMMQTWCFNDWMYRPRLDEELDTAQGGGVTFRQGAHQFDILRYLGGGQVRSVRAQVGRWDASRPTEGAHTVFLEFEDGVSATAVYNGYDHFHTTELTFGIGEWGRPTLGSEYGARRKQIKAMAREEESHIKRAQAGFRGVSELPAEGEQQPFFGITLVSCERGDIRQSPNGLFVYSENGIEEVQLGKGTPHDQVIDEWISAVLGTGKPVHTAAWGLATLEVCVAVLESSKRREEVLMQHQVSVVQTSKLGGGIAYVE